MFSLLPILRQSALVHYVWIFAEKLFSSSIASLELRIKKDFDKELNFSTLIQDDIYAFSANK